MADRAYYESLLVRLIEEFWNQPALDRFTDFFKEDAVLHSNGVDYAGRAGIVETFARPFLAAFPGLRHDTVELLIDGNKAAMRYRGAGHLQHDYEGTRAMGQPFEYHGNAIFRLADGRIAEVWSHSDMGTWLSAQPRA